MARSRSRTTAIVIGLALGATVAFAGAGQVAVGTYTYEPGALCSGPAVPVPNTGLTNMGFETGDFTGWRFGRIADDISIVSGSDGYNSPNEGAFMARLGSTYGNPEDDQPVGPNELCQDFVVDQPVERFAYRVFTWDGDDYDHFQYRLTVVDPATNTLIGQISGGGFGQESELKSTGWQEVTIDLSGMTGDTLRIYFEAGGSEDESLGTWAYLDAARPLAKAGKTLSLQAGPKKVRKGKRTTLTARMTPCVEHAGDTINFFRKNNQIASIPSDGNCVASMRVRVQKKTWFSAHSPEDADSGPATSNSVRVRIKPKKD